MEHDTQTERRWPLWTAGAGAAGVLANFVFSADLTEEQRRQPTAEIVGLLDRGPYHGAAVSGFLAVALLLVAAAGWWRFADERRTGVAGQVVPFGLLASAGAGILSYGIKGMLAIYLPGGMNEGGYPPDGFGVLVALDDLLGYVTWWGVGIAVLAIAWLGLVDRVLPRWIGAVGLLLMLPPLALLLVFGFTGMTGVTTPLALVVIGVGLAVRGTAAVTAQRPVEVGVPA